MSARVETVDVVLLPERAGDDVMPPKGDPLSEAQRKVIGDWIAQGAEWADGSRVIETTALTDDLEFLRRASLDTVGVVPSAEEIEAGGPIVAEPDVGPGFRLSFSTRRLVNTLIC